VVLKTEGEVHDRARRIAVVTGGITVAMIGAVSLATPFLEATYWVRWFTLPTAAVAAPVPILVAVLSTWLYRSLTRDGHDLAPFLLTLGLFALCFVGLSISLWPYIIPTSVTLWEAAAPPSSQWFMLVGALVMLPLILGYTGYAYWVFRGKLDPDEGYH